MERVFLNEQEAAQFLRLSPKTMARWRYAGRGPRYRKFGGAVRYHYSDLQSYAEGNTHGGGEGRCHD
jgi:predicted site-specific integrase-resolvase